MNPYPESFANVAFNDWIHRVQRNFPAIKCSHWSSNEVFKVQYQHSNDTEVAELPINPKLLEIIRCPTTKQTLLLLTANQLDQINRKVADGVLHYADGSLVADELVEGLITDNGETVYRIDSGIPIMLEDRSIAMVQVE